MNLKTQIAVIVLALTATTSPVWSPDKQALQSPTAQSLQGTWRVTGTVVNCITGQDIFSFPRYRDLPPRRHLHRLRRPSR